MYESDADRLAMIRGLGGIPMLAPTGTIDGVFESDYVAVGDIAVDSSALRLIVRSSDVQRLGVSVGVTLQSGENVYIVRSVQPDGTGMTTLVLEGP